MTEIINLYYDKEKKNPIAVNIDFGIVEAGKEEERIIYIENKLPVKLDLEYILNEKDKIEIISAPVELRYQEVKGIKFKIKTKLFEMKPLKDIISIKASWLVS